MRHLDKISRSFFSQITLLNSAKWHTKSLPKSDQNLSNKRSVTVLSILMYFYPGRALQVNLSNVDVSPAAAISSPLHQVYMDFLCIFWLYKCNKLLRRKISLCKWSTIFDMTSYWLGTFPVAAVRERSAVFATVLFGHVSWYLLFNSLLRLSL